MEGEAGLEIKEKKMFTNHSKYDYDVGVGVSETKRKCYHLKLLGVAFLRNLNAWVHSSPKL